MEKEIIEKANYIAYAYTDNGGRSRLLFAGDTRDEAIEQVKELMHDIDFAAELNDDNLNSWRIASYDLDEFAELLRNDATSEIKDFVADLPLNFLKLWEEK